MAIDWVLTLQEQADFAKRIADDVTRTLEIADLSTAQAARLYRVVEQGAQTFDRILDEMEQHDIDDHLVGPAFISKSIFCLSEHSDNDVYIIP
jgi:hypothetical protein